MDYYLYAIRREQEHYHCEKMKKKYKKLPRVDNKKLKKSFGYDAYVEWKEKGMVNREFPPF